MNRKEVKVDCHVHSCSSQDSIVPALVINEERQRQGLGWVAITDHNAISEIAIGLKENSGKPFILGEEILTSDENSRGKTIEIIGLFLEEEIKPGKTVKETVYRINAQRGIVVIPHPFEEWRHGAGWSVSREVINTCLEDRIPVAVEVFNARAGKNANFLAKWLWLESRGNGVLATAGSDAHRIPEISRAYVGLPPFRTRGEFIEALKQAEIYGEVNALGTLYHRLMNKIEVAMNYSFLDLQAIIAWERRGRRGY